MNLLAFDTATEACSVAACLEGRLVERFESAGRTHTERLMPMLHSLLEETGTTLSAVDGLVCGIGPGSFAGVRIAVGYVKGLALALDRPVVGVSSLPALALRAFDQGAENVIAAIDARMNEVYWGVYRRGPGGLPVALQPEAVSAPGELGRLPAAAWTAVGTGWGAYGPALREATGIEPVTVLPEALPHAVDLLRLALPRFAAGEVISADQLVPLYLRNKVALTLHEQAALRARSR